MVSGPTAVGKGTVVARLRKLHPDVWVSVSVTTRARREGEVDGVHYSFVSEAEFDDLIANDGLLEWATVHGTARYGTPRRPVREALDEGRPVLLEIEIQGARLVAERCPEAKLAFIAPPQWDDLVRRLEFRGTESDEERRRRLDTAAVELAAQGEFDRIIVNDKLEHAVAELVDFMGL